MQSLDLTNEEQTQEGDLLESVEVLDLELTSSTEGVQALEDELAAGAEDFRVNDFKCVMCSLVHGHDTDKHRASDKFGISHKEAGEMKFNPNCHCGYNDAAQNGEKYGIRDAPTPAQARDTAPVPDGVHKQLRS